ncbi:hypothetical protein [Pseudomonas mosselii]|uniref:hypothetical protein n=1 Tax=Pseudomonas mosselii TaxID=78327 RepID=UPI0012FD5C83|nr:hypothetical protein [Pseudomonas mosselii]UVN46349.1 hypothetical protein NW905_10240 [Pseudomonas mosselii]
METTTMSNISKQLYELMPTADNLSLQNSFPAAEWQLYKIRFPDLVSGEPQVIKVDADCISPQNSEISIPLPNGKIMSFGLDHFSQEPGGRPYWHGSIRSDRASRFPSSCEVVSDPLNKIFLSRYENRLRGEIVVEGQLYCLEFLGNDIHVLFKAEDLTSKGCSPIEEHELAEAPPKYYPSHNEISKFRILYIIAPSLSLVFPPQFIDDLVEAIKDCLASVNTVLRDSQVNIAYELAAFRAPAFVEDYRNEDLLIRLRDINTPIGKQIADERDSLGAHIVLVARLQSPPEDPIYKAYQDAKKTNAFAVLGISNYSTNVGHQLGHLMGARHELKPGDIPIDPGYEYPYEFPDGEYTYLTMMAKEVADVADPYYFRHYSNPRQQYEGKPLGTVERNDVVRRFNERRLEVETWYPDKK